MMRNPNKTARTIDGMSPPIAANASAGPRAPKCDMPVPGNGRAATGPGHTGQGARLELPFGESRSATKLCCFTIDFEDYLHDYQYSLGVREPRRGPEALSRSYELIDAFANETLGGARLTFFTTGQVARDYPEIVARIARDGHEIACHYYEHDQIWHDNPAICRGKLARAVDVLGSASGQPVRGFRAPDFSIDDRCGAWAYEVLSEFFDYDSSYVSAVHKGDPYRVTSFRFANSELAEFAIYKRRLAPGVSVRVIGGTYLRFLPLPVILSFLDEAWRNGFLPQVYLHPYDLLSNYEQWSTFEDLRDLALPSRLIRWARQHQWHTFGNRSAFDKLKAIYREFRHPGPLASLLESEQALEPAARSC